MKTELTHTYTQLDSRGNDQSSLSITVEYDTVEKDWTQLIKIQSFDCKTKVTTDLTHIFFNCFHDQAEEVINNIDWAEKADADEQPRTNWKLGMHPVFHKTFEGLLK